jgi:hypothetical protein
MRFLASRGPTTMSNAEQSTADARHYFDSRGVARVIDGRWEICRDGSNWELDFRLKYTKSS